MCLLIDNVETRKFKKKHQNHKEFTCYKVITTESTSVFFSDYKYKVGINKSNRYSVKVNKKDYDSDYYINKGIHVFTDKKSAQEYCECNDDEIVIPVICKMKDLVKCGQHNDAVFMNVRIKKGAIK